MTIYSGVTQLLGGDNMSLVGTFRNRPIYSSLLRDCYASLLTDCITELAEEIRAMGGAIYSVTSQKPGKEVASIVPEWKLSYSGKTF